MVRPKFLSSDGSESSHCRLSCLPSLSPRIANLTVILSCVYSTGSPPRTGLCLLFERSHRYSPSSTKSGPCRFVRSGSERCLGLGTIHATVGQTAHIRSFDDSTGTDTYDASIWEAWLCSFHLISAPSFDRLGGRSNFDSDLGDVGYHQIYMRIPSAVELEYVFGSLCFALDVMTYVFLALDLTPLLPSALSVLKQWVAEPTRYIFLPASAFIANAKGYPVLPKGTQSFIRDIMKAGDCTYLLPPGYLHCTYRSSLPSYYPASTQGGTVKAAKMLTTNMCAT